METPKHASPFGLIQEELRDQPWRLLVACMMLNLTNIKQVRPVIEAFFDRFPTPELAAEANQAELAELIRSLGFYNRRSVSIIKLSRAYIGTWTDVTKLPGVGKYAADSYRIFVEGKMDVIPTDKKLAKYIDWARSQSDS